ncbi:two pore domain potassium channel family protein [Thalassotalea sp. M1531]|uniref:Two pore domain potassium channel family protein n=1 Tax=Thalassotalea algicola TaxID=2716224 RepID=A0A7Y0LDM2_9GAMM|nr:two pore domain potassium channel family protein [Thalassotalea algicola]NMP32249.1 two pore domain potassium channel family protein [Thalassotalea algicola]
MIIIKKIIDKSGFYSIDSFGVKNYHLGVVSIFAIVLFIVLTFTLGYVTYIAEANISGSTIEDYGDAVWLMLMASSTIGFGGELPVTLVGRITVFTMFVLGVGILGLLGGLFAQKAFGFSDTNIKNRELRKQNQEILNKVNQLEAKIDALISQKSDPS